MDESRFSILISTASLRAVIDKADVAPEFRSAFLSGLDEAGIFAGETIETTDLNQAVSRLITENRVVLSVDFGTVMGMIGALRRPIERCREPVLIPVVRLKAVMDETPVSMAFFLDFLAGLTEAGVFAGETVDSIELGIAIGRLVADGTVSDGADFAVMTTAIAALDPAIFFH